MGLRNKFLVFKVIAFFLIALMLASSVLSQESQVLSFSGKGDFTSSPFPIKEGTLLVHITNQTECKICGAGFYIEEDNDLDGQFAGDHDTSLPYVWSAGYEAIQNASIDVEKEVMGGMARLVVDVDSRSQWTVQIKQKPWPRHEIEVVLLDADTNDYLNGLVTIIDENGEKTETRKNTTYGYFHYYFDRKFYGYRNYTIKAEVPGYNQATESITLEDWKALEFPYWAIVKTLRLKKQVCEPVQLPVNSFFDSSAEGWQITGDAQQGSSQPNWENGFITATDDAVGGVWYWKAPEKFLGDLSAAYGKVLVFSLKQSATDKPFEDNDVILETEKGRFVHKLEKPPNTVFTEYEVPFRGSAWKKDNNPVSDEVLKQALTCVKSILIRGEFRNGPDKGALDNVRIGTSKTAQIPCSVKDQNTKKPLANAVVTAVDASGRFKTSAITGSNGWCTLSGIPEGSYQVTAFVQGYEKKTLPGTALSSRTVLPVIFELKPTGKKADLVVSITGPSARDANIGEAIRLNVGVKNLGPNPTKAKLFIRVNRPHRLLYTYDPTDSFIDTYGTLHGLTAIALTGSCTFKDENSLVDCELDEIAPQNETIVTLYLRGMKAETVKITASVEANSDEILEVNKQDNRKTFSFPFLAVPFKGKVYAIDKRNKILPLSHAVMEVTRISKNGEKLGFTTYTDLKGFFEGKPVTEIGEKAFLKVYLKDKDNIITVRDYTVFNGEIVSFETKQVEFTPKNVGKAFRFVHFSSTSPLASNKAKRMGKLLRSAANLYAETYRAMRFGKKVLGMRYDHKLPVDIYIAHPKVKCAACYVIGTSTIYFAKNDADYTHPDNPDNGPIHEFGHHVNADSLMGGRNTYYKTGKNHAGVLNSDSSDSLVEGFAEFFSAMVRNNKVYHMTGGNIDFEKNFHYTRYKKKWIPHEESNVAALLWDLADTVKDQGDNLAYGFKGTWSWLNQQKVKHVHSLYVENRKYTPDSMDFNKNGIQDVDELFIAHKFFYDADEDKKYDAGEEVGYAGFWPVKGFFYSSTYRREKIPPIPGSALKVSLSKKPYPVTWYRVKASYTDGRIEEFTTTATPEGLLYLPLSPDLKEVSVSPELSGYTAKPWSIKSDSFVEAVDKAQDNNKDFFAEHLFEVMDSGVVAPKNLVVRQESVSSVSLSWNSTLPVRVARALSSPPLRLKEGVIVYQGNAQKWIDENVEPGEQYFYSVFAEKNGLLSKPVSANIYIDEAWDHKKLLLQAKSNPRKKESTVSEKKELPVLLLFLLVVAAAILYYYKNKKSKKEDSEKTVAYFAYGSNMDRKNMEKQGVRVFSEEIAFANGWARVFNKKASAVKGKGFANLVKKKNSTVYGVLYRIAFEDLKKLDEFELVPEHYTRRVLTVNLEKDKKTKVKAQAYFASEKHTANGLKPSKQYLNFLVRGARSHGLPSFVLKELKQTPVLSEKKHKKKRAA